MIYYVILFQIIFTQFQLKIWYISPDLYSIV